MENIEAITPQQHPPKIQAYKPEKKWHQLLKILGFICLLYGVFILMEPFLDTRTISQVCVSKESEYDSRLDNYSYRLNFNSGHQYVDADVYTSVDEGDSVQFKCLPYHYIINEITLPNGSELANLQNYYAHLAFGAGFLLVGLFTLFLKFKMQEYFYLWCAVIFFTLIFILIDFKKVFVGNPFKGEVNQLPTVHSPAVDPPVDVVQKESSDDTDDLMLRLMHDEVKLPIDSTTALKCYELLETSLSVSNKLFDSNLEHTPEGRQFISATMVIYLRGTKLLDSSKNVMDKKLWKEYVDLKSTYDARWPDFYLIYQEFSNETE